ncbi:MAG: type II toxin-antitoxin system Phd/YefM family antitoxin [Ardenticatenaceae bacterium]|nr:type II toxin-antitoxin system Phd/YefM family antitoxin [Ardenticatenaceae bacterium]
MNTSELISEPTGAHATSVSHLQTPVILEHAGQPVAVVLSYEEFKKLQALRADEEQRLRLGWWGLERLLAEIHGRPSELSPEEIEAEITAASPSHLK